VRYPSQIRSTIEVSNRPLTIAAQPTSTTGRGPHRSDARPAGNPSTKRKKIVRPNKIAVDPLPEPNSSDIADKKVVKLYVTPKMVAVDKKVAATTNQPLSESTPAANRWPSPESFTKLQSDVREKSLNHAPTM
jgi:hypothetical protein